MKPVPLTSPTGVLYGFACGRCGDVCVHSTQGGVDRRLPSNIALSMQEALRCCVCRYCGKEFGWTDPPQGLWHKECDDKATAERIKDAKLAERKARRK